VPKLEPVIETFVPTGPLAGETPEMVGGRSTVKGKPLLFWPFTVTMTLPLDAPAATGTVMLLALHAVGDAIVPLNATVLVPWVAPKLLPAMVTEVPSCPEVGDRLVRLGPGLFTVKGIPLLGWLLTVTTKFPLVAPAGTKATMLLALQVFTMAGIPLRLTELVPWTLPKFEPVMVMESPKLPEVGEMLAMLGANPTTNGTPLLTKPLTVTTTFPLLAPDGTGTPMLLLLQLVGTPARPLNVTVLVPCEAPKLAPVMVMEVPTGATTGDTLLMLGGVPTVNTTPLLGALFTVTITLPVVAPAGTSALIVLLFQLVAVAVLPLKVTVLVPCIKPKPAPVIVTVVPAGPAVGETLVMLGAGMVKRLPVLGVPFTVTTTFPVLAPAGTGATIVLSLQLTGVADVPLNVTVLLPCVVPKLFPVMVTMVLIVPVAGDRLLMRA